MHASSANCFSQYSLILHNDFKFSDILIWANSADPDQTVRSKSDRSYPRSFTVCNYIVCTFKGERNLKFKTILNKKKQKKNKKTLHLLYSLITLTILFLLK